MIDETLDFIRNGGALVRYHTVQVLQRQTIAEHSFHVAMLVWWLTDFKLGSGAGHALSAALVHDLAEHKMGDLPAPVKRSMPSCVVGKDADHKVIIRSFRKMWDEREQEVLTEAGLADPGRFQDIEGERTLKLADAAEGCLYCIREREMGNRLITECYKNFHEYVSGLVTSRPREQALLDHIDAAWERACGYAN